jgi:GNAT superfamily N-acetyltransferase
MPDKKILLDLFTRYERQQVQYPGIQLEDTGAVIRGITVEGDRGFIGFSRLTRENMDAVITEQVEYFRRLEVNFEWKAYDYDFPQDLVRRLEARGFQIEEPEALMVLDLEEDPPILLHPLPERIQRISNPDEIEAVRQVEEAVWHMDYSGHAEVLKRDLTENPDYLSVFVAYANDRPVSAAWIYYGLHSPFCGLWGGSTLPEFRGQGWYTALLAARLREALLRGYRYVTIDAGPMSRPIVEKHGFQLLGFSTPCLMKFHE